MSKVKNMIRYFEDKKYREGINLSIFGNYMSDEQYLKRLYKHRIGRELDLDNPKTYTEKIQWLKLYDHNPDYTIMQDKYLVRHLVAEKIGENYLIPQYASWKSVEEIDFSILPNEFVLKCNHDYNSVIICKDKNTFDFDAAKMKLDIALKREFWKSERQWAYKDIPRRIIAEKYMKDGNEDYLTDYKFFCFNGEPKIMYCSKDKAKNPTTDFFDMDYNQLQIVSRDPNSPVPPEKPKQFEKMKELAHVLSDGYPHVRVDFYVINGMIYFGELTMYHNSGLIPFKPQLWEEKMGEWIALPRGRLSEN